MLYRSAVFTFSSICSIRKVYVTPMPDTSSLKSIILKIPFALGHIPSTSAWHFCLLCMHFSTRSSQKFIQLDLLQKFYISKSIFLAKIISIQKCGFPGQDLQKKRMKQKAGQLLFFIYGWTSKNTKKDHHLRQRGLFSHQGQLCSLFGPHHDVTSDHYRTKTSRLNNNWARL